MDLTYDGSASRREAAISAAHDILRAQVSRNSLQWSHIEPVPGVRDWSRTDSVVEGLRAAGIEPLLTFYGSPSWANGVDPSTPDQKMYVPTEPDAFDAWADAYEDFIRAAVRRYRGRVRLWEVWNEPNERFFWKPAPDVQRYATFFTRMRRAILDEDPGAEVAVGGLAGLNASIDIPGITFLDGLIARHVVFDRVAIHPYSDHSPLVHVPWDGNFDDIALVEARLRQRGRDVPLWVTEWGWSDQSLSEVTQAEYLAESLQLLSSDYRYVSVATVFLDADRLPLYSQGLLRSDFSPKPAALEFAKFVARQ
jgi:hypothetical protein